ncbi:leucyl aminopeptidase [Luteithermobacter gelatinilyticus]|uniref:leucyl aminopeptidase n=1 Tax=Luteithermobacter gelatinilyticus TaxID=2582913 RepID=UPI001106D5F9|nr:leucyl aminopeptidase [Luteithermobacter gelatinilyticus]
MKINFIESTFPKEGSLVVFGYEEKQLSEFAKQVDKKTDGQISRAMEHDRYEGKFGQTLCLSAPSGLKVNRLCLVGLGKEDELDELKAEKIGGKIMASLMMSGDERLSVAVETSKKAKFTPEEFAAHLAYGAKLRRYRFDKYRTKEREEKKPSVIALDVMLNETDAAATLYDSLDAVAEGVIFARDLVSEPGNVIYPESYAEQIKQLSALGVDVEVLGEDEMEELGMGALLGVGQGSASESHLVIMRWNGSSDDEAPLAFVGKGVTFDTGGISLKPGAGMEDMKFDMGGSAAVVGLMKALAGRKAKVNAVGVVGLVENMPSGTAQRPGDVVTSMSGQTIEVINTDAEGRLVLADALWYTQDKYKPKLMIDLATLTGAILISLGQEYAGIFSNNDELAAQLVAAGEAVEEKVWRLPLGEAYDELINSDVADMKNIGGRNAGSITAAQFLQRFVNDVPWVHIDIAGTAWKQKASDLAEKGATGYGVRLLDRLIRDNYED